MRSINVPGYRNLFTVINDLSMIFILIDKLLFWIRFLLNLALLMNQLLIGVSFLGYLWTFPIKS